MARNPSKDAREAQLRTARMIEAGFRLFSEKGIENVSLQQVANAADVGIATLYKYFKNKVNLAVAVSTAIWSDFWKKCQELDTHALGEEATSYESIGFYCDQIILLFRERPQVLRFSSDYKTFINRQKVSPQQTQQHIDALAPVKAFFSRQYQNALTDHSIRTDIQPEELFTTVMITMLAMAERYAAGLVWANEGNSNHVRELEHVKEMLLLWCTSSSPQSPN